MHLRCRIRLASPSELRCCQLGTSIRRSSACPLAVSTVESGTRPCQWMRPPQSDSYLVAEAFGPAHPEGYTYFAMGFSVLVEMLNIRLRRKAAPVHLHQNP